MNKTYLSGTVVGKPFPIGQDQNSIRFLVRCPHKFVQNGQGKEVSTVVPCLAFNCPRELKELLQSEAKDIWIEADGRINRSSFEGSDGERKYSTEVVINPLTAFAHKKG